MGVIDFEFFKIVIDQADKLETGAITIASRGEPTMHPKLGKMLKYLSSKENIFFTAGSNNQAVAEVVKPTNIDRIRHNKILLK